MDPALKAEIFKGAVQAASTAVGAGVALYLGWRILRAQEQVKREEELRASMRRLRVDALVRALEALGAYHNVKDRRLQGGFTFGNPNPASIEQDAARALVDTLAREQFLLGETSNLLSETFRGMAKAMTNAELSTAVAKLHASLEAWIPQLEPLGKGGR